MEIFIRTPYNYDRNAVSRETATVNRLPSMAVQAEKDEADINTIVRRFGITGRLPTNVKAPMYGDFTDVGDYREAIHAIREADQAFAEMPASVRKRFGNSAAEFVDFCSDPKNRDEAISLGLVVVPPVPEPPAVAGGGAPGGAAGTV